MKKIVLTGGPCGGKTTILATAVQKLEDLGYKIFIVPETATPLITNGLNPKDEYFQQHVIDVQLVMEKTFNEAAKRYGDKVVVFYDRGVLDGKAYIPKNKNFNHLMNLKNLTYQSSYDRYDAVLHLVTAADGAEKYYQWIGSDECNNTARRENPHEAKAADAKTLESWIGHPHLKVIDNSGDFEDKIKRVIKEIYCVLGEPIPKEIERKFLVVIPDLENLPTPCNKINITQIYLNKINNTERRVRKRGSNLNGYSYYYTEKTEIGHGERIENEEIITLEEYNRLLYEKDLSLVPINKTRYCFIYKSQHFELDIYPSYSDKYALLEIELNDINELVNLPLFNIEKEVTSDKSYSNYEIARNNGLPCENNSPITRYKKLKK